MSIRVAGADMPDLQFLQEEHKHTWLTKRYQELLEISLAQTYPRTCRNTLPTHMFSEAVCVGMLPESHANSAAPEKH